MIIYKITDNREYIVLYIPHLRGKLKCTKRKIRHGNPGSQNNKKKSQIEKITRNILKGKRQVSLEKEGN